MSIDYRPERMKDESFEDYKKRRAINNKATRIHLQGRLFWSSYDQGSFKYAMFPDYVAKNTGAEDNL